LAHKLGEDTGVAELLHVLDAQHTLHHLLVAELLQSLEVEMPKALVPQPSVIVAASWVGCKTKGLHHLHMKDVEEVAPSVHLAKKAATPILDV
jgi:hypothetical protein